eukprot:14158556-Heterocapsa_arctica.AAC.1
MLNAVVNGPRQASAIAEFRRKLKRTSSIVSSGMTWNRRIRSSAPVMAALSGTLAGSSLRGSSM